VYRIECDDRTVLDTEFRQQRLRCRDLVGFLGDIDVGEYQGRVGGERTQYLRRARSLKLSKLPRSVLPSSAMLACPGFVHAA